MTSTAIDLLIDAFGRVREAVHEVVDGMTEDELAFRADADANSIAWLVWHLTRIQDDHVAAAADREQTWTAEGWYARFALPFPPEAHGYGHGSDDVAAVRVAPDVLIGYHDAVHRQTLAYVATLRDGDFGRVVDRSWDPPVTLGVRLVSVVADDLMHAGQAAFVRGLVERSRRDTSQ